MTTFAVVAGVTGAQLPNHVAAILGVANLLADGFSMAVSNFLGVRTEAQVVDHVRKIEEKHIEKVPEGERAEIRQIFAAKGFSGELLEEIVNVITRDRERLARHHAQRGIRTPDRSTLSLARGPGHVCRFCTGGTGAVIAVYLFATLPASKLFGASGALTAFTFFLVGAAKGRIVRRSVIWSGLETMAVGLIAATLAYVVGVAFHGAAN